MNEKSTTERLVFSPRMERVREGILSRLKPYAIREMTHTCPVQVQTVCDPITAEFEEHPNTPYLINLANGIVRSWMETPFVIFPCEAVVGITRPDFPVMEHFSFGLEGAVSVLSREQKEEAVALYKRLVPLDVSYVTYEYYRILGKEKYEAFLSDRVFTPGYQGHTVPNYPTLLELGLDGMLEKIQRYAALNGKDQESLEFYEANHIVVSGMSNWLMRYSEVASSLAEKEIDEVQRKYYLEIANNCRYVAHKKPTTLYQAVQLMWCLSLWDWVDCVGRVDQYLFPFFKASMESGDLVDPEDAIVSIVFKLWENGSHNVTLSGVLADGTDATNPLTYLLLQVLRNIHDTHPRMSVRVHPQTPKELLELVVQMWSEGMSDPTVVSDVNVIAGLEEIGVIPEDARDYSMLGCQEVEIPGKSNFGCEDAMFNLAKVFEYAINGGKSTTDPKIQLGPETKPFSECETFEEFFASFQEQLAYFTELCCRMSDRCQEIRWANSSKLVKTPFTDGCLEKGKSHDMGGPIYNYGVIETAGLAPVADSMTAIKKLVYDEKTISKETLLKAIKANFHGYEKERQILLNRAPKFGNDDDEADEMAVRVLKLFWSECGKYRSIRGGVYVGACSLLEGGITFGKHVGAMPDGRFAAEPLGNTMGPRPGADKNGLTAMLSSVAKLPLKMGVGGTTLNVLLTTKLLSNPALRTSIAATMYDYLMKGGQMAQITTANLEDLMDAKVHPERHGDLIVRVGGFSVQFVQLGEESQNEIISRYNE